MAKPIRPKLGRGLSSLLGEDSLNVEENLSVRMMKIDDLASNRHQPRRHFDEAAMKELAASIREKGVLQPVLVRRNEGSHTPPFEIVAGERRWRAARLAGLHEIPVILGDYDDPASFEIALIENLQREDLNPLEQAEGYEKMRHLFRHTQDNIARIVGKSRASVANSLRLLALPAAVRKKLAEGKLSASHARSLIGAKDPLALANRIIREGWNVRDTESLVKKPRPTPKGADIRKLEEEITQAVGLKVAITYHPTRGGNVTVRYRTLEQFENIVRRLRSSENSKK